MNTQRRHKKSKKVQAEKITKISPKEYKGYLEQTELESISLLSCSARLRKDKFGETMKHSVSDKVKYDIPEPHTAILLHEYQFIVTPSTKRDFAVKIICEFEVELTSQSKITEDFLEIFSRVNLPMNTWPYFREFVQNMLQRMGLPPFTLPFLKS